MKKSAYILLMMLIISLSAFTVGNEQSDHDQMLLVSCQTLIANPDMDSSCVYYIQGFLAAAKVTDPFIKKSDESRKGSGFASRAYQVRDRVPPARFIPFCVPDDVPKEGYIKMISKQLSSKIDTLKKLNDMIFKTLKTEYPCIKYD